MHGTLRSISRLVYGLLLVSSLLLSACGEYEYIRTVYPGKSSGYDPSTNNTTAPTTISPALLPPEIPKPAEQEWLNAGCFVDLTALNNSPYTQQLVMDVLRLPHSPAGDIKECFSAGMKMNIRFEIDSLLLQNGPPSRCILINRFQDICPVTDSSTLNIRILLNPYHLARSTRLAVAASVIHELMHAYFFYRSAEAFGDRLKERELSAEFPLLKPFRLYKNYVPGNHHEQMAQRYVDKMAHALKEYQLITEESLQPLLPYSRWLELDDYYRAVAWAGLAGSVDGDITQAWTKFKSQYPKTAVAYEIIIAAEHNCTVLSAAKNKCGQ